MSKAARFLALALIVLSIAACGKKGAPRPPADEPDVYPRHYPTQ
jgi:predicted small lipoprotein YifL